MNFYIIFENGYAVLVMSCLSVYTQSWYHPVRIQRVKPPMYTLEERPCLCLLYSRSLWFLSSKSWCWVEVEVWSRSFTLCNFLDSSSSLSADLYEVLPSCWITKLGHSLHCNNCAGCEVVSITVLFTDESEILGS